MIFRLFTNFFISYTIVKISCGTTIKCVLATGHDMDGREV